MSVDGAPSIPLVMQGSETERFARPVGVSMFLLEL